VYCLTEYSSDMSSEDRVIAESTNGTHEFLCTACPMTFNRKYNLFYFSYNNCAIGLVKIYKFINKVNSIFFKLLCITWCVCLDTYEYLGAVVCVCVLQNNYLIADFGKPRIKTFESSVNTKFYWIFNLISNVWFIKECLIIIHITVTISS